MAFADTQKLVVEIDLRGNITQKVAGLVRDLRGFDKATSNTQRSLGKFSNNISKLAKVGLVATAGGFLAVVDAARDYESAFAGVRKTVDATEGELQELSDQFRALSKEIPVSAAELARLGEAGGALGVPTEQLEEFVRVTALLGVTTDLTSDQAAESLGILSNVLHLTGDEYQKFASSLVALGNAGASTESQIVEIAARAGAAGELVGVSTQQVLGFSSAVASLGIEVEAGGTALQTFFIDSAKFIAEGGAELETFAKVTGVSAKTFKKAFDKDAGAALQRFLDRLGQLEQGEQLAVLEDLGFNNARITRTLLGLANNTKLVADQQKIANDAFRENTALTKEAEERFKTFDSQLQRTKNVLTDIGITIGSKLLPKLTPLLQKFNQFVSENQGQIEEFGTKLADGFEKIADAVGKTDWTPFIDGLRLSAQLAKGAFDAFNALPDDFKKLILVGFGINKFTGGLITSVGKDLFGAIGSQFFARGSSPANPMWVQMSGAGLTPGAGGTGGKGAAGKILDAASKLLIVGLVAEAANLVEPMTTGIAQQVHDQLGLPDLKIDDLQWPFGPKNTPTILPEIFGGNGVLGGTPESPGTVRVPENPRLIEKAAQIASRQNITNERLESIKVKQDAALSAVHNQRAQDAAIDARNAQRAFANQQAAFAIRDKVAATQESVRNAGAVIRDAELQTKAAAAEAGRQAAAAIRDKDLSVTTNVKVNTSVSVRETIHQQTTYKKYYTVHS